MTDALPNRIELTWVPPPAGGVYGPHVRLTGGHGYALFKDGRKLMSGSTAPDFEQAKAYALSLANRHGVTDPAIIVHESRER